MPEGGEVVLVPQDAVQRAKVAQSTLLFYWTNMAALAQRVVRCCQAGTVELGAIRWNRFPDGTPKLFIENVEGVWNRDVVFIADFQDTDSVFEQISVLMSFSQYSARSLMVVLPYFPTGTMERVDMEGDVATAHTLARILSAIPQCAGCGPSRLLVYDIHALQERFYFGDSVIPLLDTAVPLLRWRLEQFERELQAEIGKDAPRPRIVLAYPDEGARKRFATYLRDYDVIVCSKRRQGNERIVIIKEGSPTDCHVVIVDDLVQSGGTLRMCAHACRSGGALSVSCFVPHGVFPNDSWQNFKAEDYRYFWLTDSCPGTAAQVAGRAPFEVLSLAPLIAKVACRMGQAQLDAPPVAGGCV